MSSLYCALHLLLVINCLWRSSAECLGTFDSQCNCRLDQIELLQKNGRIVTCTNLKNIQDDFPIDSYPIDIVSLELSSCRITNVSQILSSTGPSSVQKILQLILADNEITFIQPSTFSRFDKLQILNLSHNNIAVLYAEMFEGLSDLKYLYLDYNSFSTIPGDAFSRLPLISLLDLRSDCLICNCLMQDFVKWFQTTKKRKKIVVKGECVLPIKGKYLTRLKPEALQTCGLLETLPYFEIYPSNKQIMFEGDSLHLECEGTNLPTSKITWNHKNSSVNPNVLSALTDAIYQPKVSSTLQLDNINKSYSGTWSCTVSSNYSYVSQNLDMVVIKQEAKYCQKVNITNDLGQFVWPETISGITAYLSCAQPLPSKDPGVSHKASRTCMSSGQWTEADYSQCELVDDFARLANKVVKKHITEDNALEECNLVTQLLSDVKLTEIVSLKLLEQLMHTCQATIPSRYLTELATIIVELASKACTSPFSIIMDNHSSLIFFKIQKNLQDVVQHLFDKSLSFTETSSNVAVFGRSINSTNSCLLCNMPPKKGLQTKLECELKQKTINKSQYAVIKLFPPEKFGEMKKVSVVNYRNGNIFQSANTKTVTLQYYKKYLQKLKKLSDDSSNQNIPEIQDSKTGLFQAATEKSHVIISNVLSLTINNHTEGNLSRPAQYVFETTEKVLAANMRYGYYIALWSGNRWQPTKGFCRFNQTRLSTQAPRNLTVAECTIFGTLAIIKNVEHGDAVPSIETNYKPMLHLTAIVGGGFLSFSLLLIFFTYFSFPRIRISRDARHMLLNQCIHFFIAIVAFLSGIWRVNSKIACYTTGILLHYSSLSILLWITISSRNICKEMLMMQNPPSLEPKPTRPMLRFYLIGCGIPVIICGITAAAKIQNYNGDGGKYCWLSWETSLYAFYGPAALIAIYCIIVLLRILATLNCTSNNQFKGKGAKNYGTDTNDESRSPIHGVNGDSYNHVSYATKDIDNEQSYRTRLRGVSLSLVFFIATWTAAAMSVAAPHIQGSTTIVQYSPFQNTANTELEYYSNVDPEPVPSSVDLSLVFSCIFSIFAIATAIFLLVQQMLSRKDVRTMWKSICTTQCKSTKSSEGGLSLDSNPDTNMKNMNRRQQGTTATTITDPATIETVLNTASLSGDLSAAHHTCTSHHSSHAPRSSVHSTNRHYGSSYIMYSSGTVHNKFTQKELKHNNTGKVAQSSVTSSQHYPVNNLYLVQDTTEHLPEFPNYHYEHHYCREGYMKNQTKPIKLTNLQQHYDNLTDHSLEEGQNMHTIPVIMQQPQRKLDNGALYNRYQKMRKALDAKKRKPPRLTVLREHAQDSLSDDVQLLTKRVQNGERTSLLGLNGHKSTNAKPKVPLNFDSQGKEKTTSLFESNGSVDSDQNVQLYLGDDTRTSIKTDLKNSTKDCVANPNLIAYYKKNVPDKNEWKNFPSSSKDQVPQRKKSERGKTSENQANISTFKHSAENKTCPGHKSHGYLTATDILGLMHVPPKLERVSHGEDLYPLDIEFNTSHQSEEDLLSLGSSHSPFLDDHTYASLRNETSV
uniref:Probable G-protein coupled receptor 125 n=1 Tax=Phallusia mammillata TaxID=59560 RepID=A0A6F9DDB2_9ASCI|nr:probable G-protein coupled receptor 125 [Phallusia mammillata]